MSAQVTILQLPAAGAITGTEAVPIVQNGVTVQTTTGAIAASPSQPYTYLTVTQTPQLANSRYVGATNGLSITDGGAQGLFNISTTGALLSLVNSSTGFQVKTDSVTLTNRSIAVTNAGLSITNGSGVSGDPTISLDGQVLNLANVSANGLLTITTAGAISAAQIQGTANQIGVANGTGIGGSPTISIVDNAVLPGTGGVTLPNGTTAQQPVGASGQMRYNTSTARFEGYTGGTWVNFGVGDGSVTSVSGTADQISVVNGTTTPVISLASNPIIPGSASITMPIGDTAARPTGSDGMFRYNTDLGLFEGYINGSWQVIAAGSTGVTSIATGAGLTGGPITSTGTISIANTAVVAGTYGDASNVPQFTVNARGQLTFAGNVPIVVAGAVTSVSGTANEITATGTTSVTLSLPSALTFTGKTITGGTYTGASISGSTNTLTNIGNSSLTNSSLTIGTTNIALGATSLTLGGLTSVAVTQDPTSALQLATKQYVDTLASSGIHYHEPVYVESPNTAGNLNATYNQPGGAGDGVGATLTNAGTQVALTIDGVLTTVGMRVLIYNQTNQVQNGVYTVTVVGDGSTNWVLTRATDADTYSPFSPNSLGQGDAFFVQAGATGAGETYICNTVGTIVFGTTNITFAQLSSAQVYSAGAGLTLTGTVFSLTTPVTAILGGTGQTSYANGDLLYASSSTALSKLTLGTAGYFLTAGASAPQYVDPSTLTIGTATNTTVTANSTNATNYLTFVSATTGNLPQLVNSSITCNPSTGVLTGGISGGTF